MEDLIEAIKSNDLVAVKKAFAPLIAEKTAGLVEARKIEIARSIMIEGEEADEDEDEDEDVKPKKKGDDDADEGDSEDEGED